MKKEKGIRYRKIEVRMWGDQKFKHLSSIQPCAQGLWIYLMTNPYTSQIPGVYRAGEAALAEELDWTVKAFREAFLEVFREGMVKASWKDKLIYLPKAIFYNPPGSPNVIVGWKSEWNLLPECDLKIEAYEGLKAHVYSMGKAFIKAFDEAIVKPSLKPSQKPFGKAIGKAIGNQEQEQEQEQEQDETHIRSENAIVPASKKKSLSGFAEFYQRYPKKKSPADAERAWIKKNLAPHTNIILDDLAQRDTLDPNWHAKNRYVPYPATYLNSGRWLDVDKTVESDNHPEKHRESADERVARNLKNLLGEIDENS